MRHKQADIMKKKASALVLVLIIIIVVGFGTTAILQAMISYSQMKAASFQNLTARYLAEAGVQYGLTQLRLGDTASPVNITTEKYAITITKTLKADGSYDVQSSVQYPDM
jgi:Tfp pilus assembly protein PilX